MIHSRKGRLTVLREPMHAVPCAHAIYQSDMDSPAGDYAISRLETLAGRVGYVWCPEERDGQHGWGGKLVEDRFLRGASYGIRLFDSIRNGKE